MFGGMGGMNMNGMMKKVQKMQKQMQDMQEQLKKQTVDATAGGGVVKITMDGEKQVKGIVIDPAAVDPEDVEMLQDLLAAAFNEATKKVDEKMAGEMSKLTSSRPKPGSWQQLLLMPRKRLAIAIFALILAMKILAVFVRQLGGTTVRFVWWNSHRMWMLWKE